MEAKICAKLSHPHVIRFVDAFGQKESIRLVFEFANGGALFRALADSLFYSEAEASYWMLQILEAISYCHKMGVVHRDLKTENILLVTTLTRADIKIADFGLAVEVVGDERRWFGSGTTPYIMSPEVSKREPFGKPVDVWACGVIRKQATLFERILVSFSTFFSVCLNCWGSSI